eukprot:TRINITY_DN8677_c0_g2_i2.p1 TRINITY_DN8677_c0_g2~~TRINITY_DN8677_c0_g2_i2.p1  ORF type:complete len:610 (+),score=44.29 TRINITY_DN8677_c0_g2_i2:495-2324(+)
MRSERRERRGGSFRFARNRGARLAAPKARHEFFKPLIEIDTFVQESVRESLRHAVIQIEANAPCRLFGAGFVISPYLREKKVESCVFGKSAVHPKATFRILLPALAIHRLDADFRAGTNSATDRSARIPQDFDWRLDVRINASARGEIAHVEIRLRLRVEMRSKLLHVLALEVRKIRFLWHRNLGNGRPCPLMGKTQEADLLTGGHAPNEPSTTVAAPVVPADAAEAEADVERVDRGRRIRIFGDVPVRQRVFLELVADSRVVLGVVRQREQFGSARHIPTTTGQRALGRHLDQLFTRQALVRIDRRRPLQEVARAIGGKQQIAFIAEAAVGEPDDALGERCGSDEQRHGDSLVEQRRWLVLARAVHERIAAELVEHPLRNGEQLRIRRLRATDVRRHRGQAVQVAMELVIVQRRIDHVVEARTLVVHQPQRASFELGLLAIHFTLRAEERRLATKAAVGRLDVALHVVEGVHCNCPFCRCLSSGLGGSKRIAFGLLDSLDVAKQVDAGFDLFGGQLSAGPANRFAQTNAEYDRAMTGRIPVVVIGALTAPTVVVLGAEILGAQLLYAGQDVGDRVFDNAAPLCPTARKVPDVDNGLSLFDHLQIDAHR